MERRRDLWIVSILVAVLAGSVATVAGCSRDLPTSSGAPTISATNEPAVGEPSPDEPRPRDPGGSTPPVHAVTFIRPEAIASIRKLPELGIFEGGGSDGGGDAQSYYFRTTDTNREFRRGFIEFVIPRFNDVFSARIVLREWRAATAHPLPPDRHELSFYTEVDRVVDTGDYDRATTALAMFETDGNVHMQSFDFDASELVRRLRGAGLGLRVKLEADPDYMGMGFLGTGFSGWTTPSGAVIEVTTTTIEANAWLRSVIARLGLQPRLEAVLQASLRRVGGILGDRDPENDISACDELAAFIDEVASHHHDGLLLPSQSTDLEILATNLRNAIGCR